jgi:hypothetical protein
MGLAALVALGGCHESAPAPPAGATATTGPAASAAATAPGVFNPGPAGVGSATDLETNRPAILHCDGRAVPLPATLWFDQAVAPEGESPFTFRSQENGEYVVSFAGSTACTFTDRAGQPLAPVDIQYQLVMGKDGPTKTVLKLMLAARPRQ